LANDNRPLRGIVGRFRCRGSECALPSSARKRRRRHQRLRKKTEAILDFIIMARENYQKR
jgi:hypothetical protein